MEHDIARADREQARERNTYQATVRECAEAVALRETTIMDLRQDLQQARQELSALRSLLGVGEGADLVEAIQKLHRDDDFWDAHIRLVDRFRELREAAREYLKSTPVPRTVRECGCKNCSRDVEKETALRAALGEPEQQAEQKGEVE